MARCPTRKSVRFNGAATFQSRRPEWPSFADFLNVMLQWSRDLSVAETALIGAGLSPGFLLQWSRDLSVAETPYQATCRLPGVKLQWSRDLSVAETWSGGCRLEGKLPASMEPRPFSRGDSLLNANSVDILFDAEHLTRPLIGTEQLGRLTRSPALSRRRSAFRTASAPYSTDAPPDPSHPDSVAHDCPSSATLSHHGQTTVTSRASGFSCLPNVLSVSEPRPCTGPVSIIKTLSSLGSITKVVGRGRGGIEVERTGLILGQTQTHPGRRPVQCR